MRRNYDFSKGQRGAILTVCPGKTRITIRIDDDILVWFKQQVHAAGGGNYQTLINDALRQFVEEKTQPLESVLRGVLREELARYGSPRPRSDKRPSKAVQLPAGRRETSVVSRRSRRAARRS